MHSRGHSLEWAEGLLIPSNYATVQTLPILLYESDLFSHCYCRHQQQSHSLEYCFRSLLCNKEAMMAISFLPHATRDMLVGDWWNIDKAKACWERFL